MPDPSQTPAPTEPPFDDALWSNALTITDKPQKYRAYRARYHQYDSFGYVRIFFRYHDPLPETAVMRIIRIDEEEGNFGETCIGPANLADAPADMLGAVICSEQVHPAMNELEVACIDTATGDVIFTISFSHKGSGRRNNSQDGNTVLPNGQSPDSWRDDTVPVMPTPWTYGQPATPDPFDWIKNPIPNPQPDYGFTFGW